MNLSKLLHQILYHAGKFLTKQYFLKENVLPEICHQLFVLFVSLWWVGESGPCAQRQGGSLYFQSTKEESLGLRGHRPALGRANAHRLCSFTELHRNTAGTQNLGCCFPGATRDFCSFLTQLGRKLRSSELQANTERAKFIPLSGKYIHNMWDLWALRSHTWRNHTNISSSQKDP